MDQFERYQKYPLWKRIIAQTLVAIEEACVVLRNRLLGVPEFLWDDARFEKFLRENAKGIWTQPTPDAGSPEKIDVLFDGLLALLENDEEEEDNAP